MKNMDRPEIKEDAVISINQNNLLGEKSPPSCRGSARESVARVRVETQYSSDCSTPILVFPLQGGERSEGHGLGF